MSSIRSISFYDKNGELILQSKYEDIPNYINVLATATHISQGGNRYLIGEVDFDDEDEELHVHLLPAEERLRERRITIPAQTVSAGQNVMVIVYSESARLIVPMPTNTDIYLTESISVESALFDIEKHGVDGINETLGILVSMLRC